MKKKILILILVSLAVSLVFAAPGNHGNKTGKTELSTTAFKNLNHSMETNNIRSCHRIENRQKVYNRYFLDNAFGGNRSFEHKKNKKH